jgi:two-component system alkaline phosphatase synthesis response regulator PhoP
MTAERGSVLVVDDDEDIREMIGMALEDAGFQAVGARDGLTALQWLWSHPRPSVILLDLMMPRLSGADFMRAHDSDPALAPIPVVIMSGNGGPCDNADFPGARHYLKKPMDLDELIEVVGQFVGAAP